MARRRRRSKKKLIVFLITLIIALIVAAVGYFFNQEEDILPPPDVEDGSTIKVHFVDVGQADSIVIMSKDGNMIIDAGTGSAEKDLKLYIDSLGIKSFKYAIFTHPHEDHIGGADMIMKNYDVENVILPDETATSMVYNNMMDAIEASNAKVIIATPGEEFFIGPMRNTILAPIDPSNNTNNSSVVIKTEFGKSSFMFTGDAEEISEQQILERFGNKMLDCDLLKMGHHGSSTSSCQEFFDAVSPSIAVITCGLDNSYGHPHEETLEKIKNANIPCYRTDKSGSLVFSCNGENITFEKSTK